MMKVICWTKGGDDHCRITVPSGPFRDKHGEDTAIELIKVLITDNLGAEDLQVIEYDDLPKSREFRNAWAPRGGKPQVDMPRARSLHMDHIRRQRDKKLVESDGPYLRAVEQDNTPEVARLKQQRQKLRDLPQTIDLSAANTPEELTAIWPGDIERSKNHGAKRGT